VPEELWVRVPVHVKPGASRPRVSGAFGDRLVVAVSARAVDGKATDSALAAVAKAFGVRRRHVRLVTGLTSRDKTVEIRCADADESRRVLQEVKARLSAT
jgi:uncharacterized protein YggU (UPF0235/DUF167 family)